MSTKKSIEKLLKQSGGQVSTFLEEAKYRQRNRKWLRYSGNIASRALAAIEEKEGLNQKTLAEQIGVTPQYVSKMLKGQENLSLETIAKLSEALGQELISFPEYKYSKPLYQKNYITPSTLYTFSYAAIKGSLSNNLQERKEVTLGVGGVILLSKTISYSGLVQLTDISQTEVQAAANTQYAMPA